MLLCCRDSVGIIEDIQESISETKSEKNEEENVCISMIERNRYSN
jgi:hypothetical protein